MNSSDITEAHYCGKRWSENDNDHACYLDLGHDGECVCGCCEEGWEHMPAAPTTKDKETD